MRESKKISWASDYEKAADEHSPDRESGLHAGDSSDTDGWQQYRKWISKAPAPRGRSIDPAVYTWKGYRSWTEQIKRNWSDNQ